MCIRLLTLFLITERASSAYLRSRYMLVCTGTPYGSVPTQSVYCQVPPTAPLSSNTTHSMPAPTTCLAAHNPAGPAPTTPALTLDKVTLELIVVSATVLAEHDVDVPLI